MTRPAIHPGEILADELEEIGITPTELSRSGDPYVGELLRTPRRQAERLAVLLPGGGAA